MIEEKAQVVAIDNASVWVEAKRESACGRCAANKGCGSAILQNIFGKKSNVLPVRNTQETGKLALNVGDEVIIGVEEGTLVKNSLVVYVIPIVTVIVFAALGETFVNEGLSISKDLASIGGAVTGFVISVAGLRWYNRLTRIKGRNQPVLLRQAVSSVQGTEIKILG